MIFEVDKNSGKIIATIQRDDTIEKYECSLLACDNPICTCGSLYLSLSNLQQNSDGQPLSSHQVDIDVTNRKLGFKDEKKIPKDDLEFAQFFLAQLNDKDFRFLYAEYFTYKNIITEEADLASIDAHFEYEDVERDGLMYAYNDVLPYGDQMTVTIDGTECLILDQYCLLPKCSCTDTVLNLFPYDENGNEADEELCAISLTYGKKAWQAHEGQSFPVSVKAVRSAIEDQLPDFYSRLPERHMKLKGIYAYCKKRHYLPKQPLQVPKVGRNEPCPCGSGKKYKKCCMGSKSNDAFLPLQ